MRTHPLEEPPIPGSTSTQGAPLGTVRVVSKRRGGTPPVGGETVIEIDRTNKVLGNRHVLADHTDDAARQRVISAYESDLAEDAARCGPMHQALFALAGRVSTGERIALRCWCAPRPCHGDPLKDRIVSLATSIQRQQRQPTGKLQAVSGSLDPPVS